VPEIRAARAQLESYMITQAIGPLDLEEIKIVRFDFDAELPATGVVLTTAVTVSMKKGVDATPQALAVGAPVIAGDGRSVMQRVSGAGRTDKAIYHLRCRSVDDDGEAHVIAANLTVEGL
jgi:hypothetical protein